jgi:HlyD family secretion protein
MMKRYLWIGLGIGGAGLAALLLRPAKVPVETARVAPGTLTVTVDEEARTRVHDRYLVSTPVAGRLSRISLRDGDAVRKGQVVARIAPAPLDPRGQDVASARLQSALATARAADVAVVRTRATMEQAKRDRERTEQLARQGIVTPEQLEQARLAEVSRSKELESAQFAAQAAAHEVEVARAGTTGANPDEDCPDVVVVTSPINGRVLRVVEQSERVVQPGTELVELGDPATLEIVGELLSSDAVRVQPGARVMIDQWGGDTPLTGRVRRVEPSGFTKISALGVEEQRVRVIIDPTDRETALGDGFRVEVRIVVWEGTRVVKVPVAALFRRGTAWTVFTVREDRAVARAVEVGQRNQLEAQVRSGLNEGDVVILHPDDKLTDGARVRTR